MEKIISLRSKAIAIVLLMLIVCVGVYGFVNFVGARLSFRDEVVNKTAEQVSNKLLQEESVAGFVNNQNLGNALLGDTLFGSTGLTATATPSLFVGVDGLNISQAWREGDNNTFTTDGRTHYFREFDFTDATITPVSFLNNFGETIYLDRAYIKITQVPTTTASMALTTSTVSSIAQDNLAVLDDGIAATARLMRPFGALRDVSSVVSTATGTIYWLRPTSLSPTSTPADGGSMGILRTVYAGTLQGTDNRSYPIPINPDVYILLYATTTKADNNCTITCTGNIFNGKLYLEFSTVD